MQKYNLCYVVCKSCTKVLCIENANWWYLYAKMRRAMCYLQKSRCYVICKMTISCYVLCEIKWLLLCALCWKMASAMCYAKPLEGPQLLPVKPRLPLYVWATVCTTLWPMFTVESFKSRFISFIVIFISVKPMYMYFSWIGGNKVVLYCIVL